MRLRVWRHKASVNQTICNCYGKCFELGYCPVTNPQGKYTLSDDQKIINTLEEIKELLSKIVYKSEKVKLPYRMGELYIKKYEFNYDTEDRKGWNFFA